MIISVPRYLIVGLAAVFSAYHVLLGVVSLSVPRHPGPYVAALLLYAIATVASLWPSKRARMPIWMASFNTAVAVSVPLLVTSQLSDPIGDNYASWYVAAVGTLMVITSTRRRHVFAWIGVGALALQTIAWAGFGALTALGVVGSVSWVAISHVLSRSLAKAGRDARQYAMAEREAVEWRAAQEAHVSERQFRLGQTSRMALPMLRQIVASGGQLTAGQRRECLYLEGAIRDEIRGRKLLNDRVREQIMIARRKGTVITLLDEGGIDDLPDDELERVHNRLAVAIRDTETGKLIARTVPEGSDTAVTVVGLSSPDDGHSSALGDHGREEADGDRVDLWLEIPRVAAE
ncbi:MAG TPA: hypothetical protein VN619_08120 [Lacisediminihabitans sp.]|nr:hypothetical protein [Lacisediminihabitans sp.]HXD61875.1 hypothetical protein [Lacisediminihabitans sp.]